MGRKKVKLQYIPNASTRRGTFQKRSRGLVKKAGELATLCDANACVVIYGEGESVPEVFPSHDEAVAILNKFKDMPEQKQFKKTVDEECFLVQRIDQLQNQVHKSRIDYEEREIRSLLHKAMLGNFPGHMGLSIEDLTTVGWKADMLLKSIGDRITKIRGQPPVYQPSSMQAPTATITGGMDIRGPAMINLDQVPSNHLEGWLNMGRYGGDSVETVVHHSFNAGHDGVTSITGFNGDEMIQPFNLGEGSGSPWVSADHGPSLSSFPPMQEGGGSM